MKRRHFLIGGALGALGLSRAAAQTRRAKIGMLSARPLHGSFYVSAVVQRLAELGYGERTGTVLEIRAAEGKVDQYPKLARELVEQKCDVIFAIGPVYTARALQDARSPAPVVFLAVDYDPLDKRIITSLGRPGGNITGVYIPQAELAAKRMQIMHEVVPAARRFLVFVDAYSTDQIGAVRKAAEAARVELTVIEFSKPPYDYAAALEAGRKAQVEALIGLASPVFAANAAALSALLVKYRLPGAASSVPHAEAGFLISYGADVTKVSRRAAEIGARILKGAKPADIPVEQAAEFELAVNARTARALELKIPESVLARATRIVQ
jgi:putative ABC transport system substrate-binding protein